MNDLDKKKNLKEIVKKSKTMNITAYEFGNNTSISTFTARQILKGDTINPSENTIKIMLDYLDVKEGKNNTEDPTIQYKIKNNLNQQKP